jgi:WG containing repeat
MRQCVCHPPKFGGVRDFVNGLAIDGKYGYLDHNGAFAIEPRFDSAFDFVSGVAQAVLNGRRCLIDANGSIISMCRQG